MDRRQLLLSVFQQGLAAVHGRTCVRDALTRPRAPRGPWHVIAVGKAADAMTLGAFDLLGPQIERALVISRDDHFSPELREIGRARCVTGSHPVPDQLSLEAGAALLEAITAMPRTHRLLALISGGASSLVECLPANVTLETLARVNEWALASGLPIGSINALRQRLSLIKGGRLLPYLRGRDVLALFISDVPGDDPDVIGSGILGTGTPRALPATLPDWVKPLLAEPLTSADTGGANVQRRIVANAQMAVAAAAAHAEAQGLRTTAAATIFDGQAAELASRFCHELELSTHQLHVWAGESTVHLPPAPGRGGRNQHLALAAARLLAAHDDLLLLAAGTDGTDGNTIDAGALVDGDTVERGSLEGLDVDECLVRADSARFLEASGDLVHTGPTGTNVGDLVLGLKAD